MSKKIKSRWLIVLFPFTLCLLCIGFDLLLFKSKVGSHPINHIDSLLLTVSDFPPQWTIYYDARPITGDFDWGEENIRIGFVLGSGFGYSRQYVYRFSNVLEARYAYFFLRKDLPVITKESPINFLTYKSALANEWYMRCTRASTGGVACDVLGRYEDYIVYFSIATKEKNQLAPEQLERLLRSIDDRMAAHLSKK
ncbi:MAG: hypothetical protein HPY45_17810 [Anaerolineae bacterium]|nr:hypothetical protein [Anaerolineae bacterium]